MKKKWIIITIILLIIAVVLTIVFINLFSERDTEDLSNAVKTNVQTGYLDGDGDTYLKIDEYFDVMLSQASLTTSDENEISNAQRLYETYILIGEFYNKQILFSSYNDVYAEYRNQAIDNLNSANSKASEIVSYLDANSELVSGSDYWQARTWDDVEPMMKEFLNFNNSAFSALQPIFVSCVDSKVVSNDFSALILSTINFYLNEANENWSSNTKSVNTASNMAEDYLTNHCNQIMSYRYSTQLQSKVEDILENGESSQNYGNFINGTL